MEKELRRILFELYGITTDEELDEELRKVGPLDISIFCGPIGEKHEVA